MEENHSFSTPAQVNEPQRGTSDERTSLDVLASFRRQQDAYSEAGRLADLEPARNKTEKVSALRQKLTDLTGHLAKAFMDNAEKDIELANRSAQLEAMSRELEKARGLAVAREAQFLNAERDLAQSAAEASEFANARHTLQATVQSLQEKLDGRRNEDDEARAAEHRNTLLLFSRVVDMHEIEDEAAKKAVDAARLFVEGDAGLPEKANIAHFAMRTLLDGLEREIQAFGTMNKMWMTQALQDAVPNKELVKRYPKALEKAEDWERDAWVQCVGHEAVMCELQRQMEEAIELALKATKTVKSALVNDSHARVIQACFETVHEGFGRMISINRAAFLASIALDADLYRPIYGIERVLSATAKSKVDLGWQSIDPSLRNVSDRARTTAQQNLPANSTESSTGSLSNAHDDTVRHSSTQSLPSDFMGRSSAQSLPPDFMEAPAHSWTPDDNSPSHTTWQDDDYGPAVNPANGLPMVGGYTGVDVHGNPFGFDWN